MTLEYRSSRSLDQANADGTVWGMWLNEASKSRQSAFLNLMPSGAVFVGAGREARAKGSEFDSDIDMLRALLVLDLRDDPKSYEETRR